ncbi:MAG: metal ABC transporter permease [Rhodospirillales bacterium CG15_BIG_FIL_POST_REV_8_21_14_020_66_15]|nr:MAG: metal ABC transporter permease [Rhodospirillales bacterium CG15_BIG_FIL_POST_REV_8_21_14_020_66_15]
MRRDHADPADSPSRNDWQTIRTLLPYLWPKGETALRWRVVIAVLFLAAAKGASVAVPLIYKYAVDALDGGLNAAVAVPVMLLLAYGLARVLAQAFGELRDAVFARVAQRAIRLAGLKTFRHLHRLSLRFHLDRKTGGISRAVERGTKGVEFLLRFMLFNIVPTLFEILLTCGILWYLFGPLMAAVTFVTIALYITWTLWVTEWRIQFRRTMNRTDNEANTKAIDSLLNFETVKYFGNEEHESRRFNNALSRYEEAAVKSNTSLAMLNIGQGLIIAVGLTAMMWMAAQGVVAGTMTIGDFAMVNAYLIQLYMPLNFLGFVYREIKQSLTDMEQMFRLLDEDPEVADRPGAGALAVNGAELVFENVSFAYDDRRPVLKDVSFTVPAGRTVAIVGPSGSGKSTISRLLFRFYDVSAGRVLVDGQDIRDVTQASLRSAIGMVPQDTVLFNDTIFYNIAYGRPGASPAEVEAAARTAQIHDFIMGLPDTYQATVGERGLKLSGGEKQRVAIARTVLKAPEILIFDEATSALDSRTEQDILKALKAVAQGRTTVTVAHRLSTVVDADEILVLEAGRIVERGSHEALLRMNGRYADMWARQQQQEKAREALEDEDDGISVRAAAETPAAE